MFRRLLLIVLIAVVVLVMAGAAGVFYLVRRPFPQIDGTLRAAGLGAPVTIIRDHYGIPHIYASSPHDLFFAQGYVHAQDRLWQMESARMAVAGRTSELRVSKSALEADKLVRTIGLRRAAEAEYATLSDGSRAILQAYTDGVNAAIGAQGDNLPIEFFIVGLFGSKGPGYRPEPWTVIDSVQWAKALSFQQSGGFGADLFNARVIKKFGPEKGADVLAALAPPYDYARSPVIVPSGVAWERVPEGLARLESIQRAALPGAGIPDTGSNSWVVAGSRTASGMPLLANDPHIGIQMPAIWYFNGLHCEPVGPDCPYEAIGSSLLGVPGVVIGHSARIALALTNSAADMRDLFFEKVTGDRYEHQGQMLALEVAPEVWTIKGRLPADYEPSPNESSRYDEQTDTTTITLSVRATVHGPLISDVDPEAAELSEYAVAYSWIGNTVQDGFVEALLAFNRVQTWDEFRAAASLVGSPGMNLIYADVEGNIGYQTFGRIPIRASGDGRIPAPGWTGEYDWVGAIPFEDLPVSLNPPQGYLVTANNAITGPEYPYLISTEFDRGYRARQITRRIEAAGTLGPDDFASMQGDNTSLPAVDIAPYLDTLPVEGDARKVLDAIRGWDFINRRDSAGAGAFETFFLYLVRNTFADELGDLMHPYVSLSGGGGVERLAITRLLEQPESEWWDDVTTEDKVETREDILAKSLADAAAALTAELGPDPAGWTWGRLHTVIFKSQALGDQVVGFIFNRGPFVVDGGWAIVNNTGANASRLYPDPEEPDAPPAKLVDIFRERQSPSLRQIVDLGDLNASRFVLTVGQSGLPYHPHYEDMIDLWRNTQYVPMWWERDAIEEDAEGVLNLTP